MSISGPTLRPMHPGRRDDEMDVEEAPDMGEGDEEDDAFEDERDMDEDDDGFDNEGGDAGDAIAGRVGGKRFRA